jgi:hypothetical protein
VNAPGTTRAADNAAAEAALRNLDAAFIGLYYLLVFHGEKPDARSNSHTVLTGFSLHARLLVN